MIVQNSDYILRIISKIPLLVSCKRIVNGISVFELNNTAKEIWELCDTPIEIESVIQHFNLKYSITDSDKQAIGDFIDVLLKLELLEGGE